MVARTGRDAAAGDFEASRADFRRRPDWRDGAAVLTARSRPARERDLDLKETGRTGELTFRSETGDRRNTSLSENGRARERIAGEVLNGDGARLDRCSHVAWLEC